MCHAYQATSMSAKCKQTLRIAGTDDHRVTGRLRSTHKCGWCDKTTSVYSILHLCGGCNTLLESPRRESSSTFKCPTCNFVGLTPADFLEATDSVMVERSANNPVFYEFPFPSRDEAWACRITDSGKLTACPECQVAFQVPCYGEHLSFERSIFATPKIRCNKCRHAIPKTLSQCPICEAKVD